MKPSNTEEERSVKKLRFNPAAMEPAWFKFAALEFIYWFAIAIGNYQTVYLQTHGFSASFIGVINATISAMNIVIIPMWGMISDKMRSIRTIFLLTMVIGAVAFAFIPLVAGLPFVGTPLLLAYLCIVYAFRNPANSMLDNWLVRYANQKALDYGSMRSQGSLGFAIAGVAIAGAVSAFGTGWTFPACSIMMIPVFLMSLRTDDTKPLAVPAAQPKKESFNPIVLFKNYYYSTFLVFAFLICLVINSAGAFLPYLLNDVGVESTRFGVITAYMAIIEIPMLMSSRKLRQSMPLYMLTILCCICYTAGCLLLSTCAHSLMSVMIIETFNGLASGLFIASASNYIYTLTPENLKATGQSIYVSVTAASGIIASLAGGMLVDAFGSTLFYMIIGFIALFSAVFMAATIFIGQKKLKLPIETY